MKNVNVISKSVNLNYYKVKEILKSCVYNYWKLRIFIILESIAGLPRIITQNFKEDIVFFVHFECWPLG